MSFGQRFICYFSIDHNKILLKKKGVIGLLVTSMRQFPDDEWLQEFTMGAIEAFAHIGTALPQTVFIVFATH